MDPYNHSTPTSTKLPILDTGKNHRDCDTYKAPPEETGKGVTSEGSAKKKGRTVAITVEDMQKRRNDVKARTTLLLALPDEHQKFPKNMPLHGQIVAQVTDNEYSDDSFYNNVPPPPAQVYSPPKKDLSWMGLPEFVDDTVTDYSRPTPSIDVSKDGKQRGKAVKGHQLVGFRNLRKINWAFHKIILMINDIGHKWFPLGHRQKHKSYLSEYEPYNGDYVVQLGETQLGENGRGGMNTVKVDLPAIGFLRPFGCHVMILNTLDHLGKFDAKGDEVETEVPTVSTPVPTECLSIPPVSSSGSRIISRGSFFSSDKVEADLSNMETDIQISPTPTLRIHKVHPKSQIIGPVDTHVQTRQKTKNMEEQSFIATIHQKTNPELLHYCLFSCFLSQEEPKKLFDALKDLSWVEAMQEELLQFKIQNVWVLVDCPNGV
ncbi:hypothetical protein Tco_1482217, partial [Tanacetum coccineum]